MERQSRVFHLITELGRTGAELLLLDTLARLNRDRFAPSVGYLRNPGTLADEFRAIGVPVHFFNMRSRTDLPALSRLRSVLRRNRTDILHTHLIDADVFGFLCARMAGVRAIISTKHNTNDFRRRKTPSVLFDSWVANRSSRLVAVSGAVKDFVVRHQGIRPGLITVIANGIDCNKFKPAADRAAAKLNLGLDADAPCILTVARLHPQKGHAHLLDAIPAVLAAQPAVRFFFAGDGPLRHDLERRAASLRVEHAVRFLGVRADIPELLRAADVFVLPSLWEGCGIAVMEAMACGTAVVASGVDGIAEIIEHGKTGVLTPAGDAAALAREIGGLLQDDERRLRIGRLAAELIPAKYSIEQTVRELEVLYDSVLDERTHED